MPDLVTRVTAGHAALAAAIKALRGDAVTVTTANAGTPNTLVPVGSLRRNEFFVTALSLAATINAPSGTFQDGNTLMIRIVDNGTARALAWDATYIPGATVTLPTVTTVGKRTYIYAIYNGSTWDVLSAGASG